MAGGIFVRLRALFVPPAPAEPVASRVLFIEEDAWGEVEVLPASNADWCREELRKISAFSEEHRAPGDAGWTDIYIRKRPPSALADLRIPLAPTLNVLGRHLPPFDRVTSGSFYDPEPVRNAWGFGGSPKMALIVVGSEEDKIVRLIYVISDEKDGAARLIAALESLPSSSRLIVVDWVRGGLIALRP